VTIQRWTGALDPGPFRFNAAGPPMRVTVRRHVVRPGSDGPVRGVPVNLGCIESEFIAGELVRRESSCDVESRSNGTKTARERAQ
jgi:hypothetical protein